MANTREVLGEQETLDGLVNHTITSFEEDGVTTLANGYTFYYNPVIESVVFPNLTEVPQYMMAETSVIQINQDNFPAATRLGRYAFYDCYKLESVDLPNITYSDGLAFAYNYRLEYVNLPGLTEIPNQFFYQCSNLYSFDTSKIKRIGVYGFENTKICKLILPVCTSLSSGICENDFRFSLIDITQKITFDSSVFYRARSLAHVILRSPTLCPCTVETLFQESSIEAGLGWIYVPTELIDEYKSATNWSSYADQIVDISEYPKLLQDETISDSWSEILASENDGSYLSKYNLGDIKYLDLNGTQVPMQIVAINGDTMSNGEKAKLTWLSKSLIESREMNKTYTSIGGWDASYLRSWLRNVLYNQIDATVKNAIKPVQKTYYDYHVRATITLEDTVWIPSYREIVGGYSIEDSGVTYTNVFSDNESRIKRNGMTGNTDYWFLRSAPSNNFYVINNNGSHTQMSPTSSEGVCLGFCT